jgi:GT2 family glycosyltransferase
MTIVIPSRKAENLEACIAAFQACEPDAHLLVVDDGLESRPPGASYLHGVKPFVFARNVNIGLRAAMESGDGVLGIWNDDALLRTPGGLSRMIGSWPSGCGIGAPACTNVGNRNQNPQHTGGWRLEPWMVCFTAVLIPRHIFERVGLLDERFVAYGWDDNDFCRRVRQTGWTIWIDDRCLVEHHLLEPTFRISATAGGDIRANAERYREKWGDTE